MPRQTHLALRLKKKKKVPLFLFIFSTMHCLGAIRTHAIRMTGRRNASTVSVQNIETRWKSLSIAEQNTIVKQLEEAQKKDWKVLSFDEKKAACE